MDDGVTNLEKFAYNLVPGQNDGEELIKDTGTSGLPYLRFETVGADHFLRFEYIRRRSVEGSLTYSIETADDLVAWGRPTVVEEVTEIDNQWERVLVRLPVDLDASELDFGRVRVELFFGP